MPQPALGMETRVRKMLCFPVKLPGMRREADIFNRFLNGVEWAGNKLPHPFMIFIYLALLVVVISWFVSLFGVSFEDPASGEETPVVSMISTEGVQFVLTDTVANFVEFPVFGLVVVLLLGIGLAQKTGLIEALMRKVIIASPRSLVTYAIVFAGIIGSWASDAATVIVPPLAGLIFLKLGRHPLAGIAVGFAAVSAGFNANLLIAATDVLLSGISTSAAQIVEPGAVVSPLDNLYFINASVFMLTIVGALVCEKIVEPRLGEYRGSSEGEIENLSAAENRGLRNSLVATILFVAVLVLSILPSNSPLRGEDGAILDGPLLSGIVVVLFALFVVVGIVYGVTVGTITSTADVPRIMGEAVVDLAGLIVLFFAASQFIAYIEFTNMSTWLAVAGADFLQNLELTGLVVIIAFIFLAAGLNLLITGGTAQWAILAPIFVPLFMLLDYDPAYTQLAFRIADSSTNIITPLNVFVPMVIVFMKEYDEDAGFGTLFSLMLPYTVFYFATWTILFVIWNLIGLPIGPGVFQDLGP